MITQSKRPVRSSATGTSSRRRSAWRQRLVEAERGITQGVRGDSTFFVHFFVGSIVVAAGMVFGLSLVEWTVVILSLTIVLSAEMFNQVVKNIVQSQDGQVKEAAGNALRIGTAAVFVGITGALLTIGLIFGHRLVQMFAGS